MALSAQAEQLKLQGNRCFSSGDATSALSYYSQAIVTLPQVLNPSESIYFSNRARVFYHLKQWEDTISDCEAAIHLTIQNIKAAILLARAKASLGRQNGTLELLQDALNQADFAKRRSKYEGNEEFVRYCKELRWKIQSCVVYLQRVGEEKERKRLLGYYTEVIQGNAELMAGLRAALQPVNYWDDPEEALVCPITLDVFHKPVCTCIGHTYECEPLQQAIRLHGYSDPITR